jgi:hypothetical protein
MDSTIRTAREIFPSASRILWRRSDLEFDIGEFICFQSAKKARQIHHANRLETIYCNGCLVEML